MAAVASSALPPGPDTEVVTSFVPSLTIRSDYDGFLGFQFRAVSAITVTSLGRWKISGNSATHTVRLLDSGYSMIRTAEVDMSAGTSGTFTYIAVSPLTLSAGSTYFIESNEASGGDQWYDGDCVLTPAAVIDSVLGAVGSGVGSTANDSYVPTSFIYHFP